MKIRVALAGNPNSGKTTLFNLLTGSHQYVGNWPGVTVEKKEGLYRKNNDIVVTDLPGIYSLSPYTLEEVVSRDFLIEDQVDLIVNVVDATNLERNLYLTTQLAELGIPVVVALNMMDVVKKSGDKIVTDILERDLNVKIVEISALKNQNIDTLMEEVERIGKQKKRIEPIAAFDTEIEEAISKIKENVASIKSSDYARWFAIKLLEGDEKLHLELSDEDKVWVDEIRNQIEDAYDDDGEGIITDGRYQYITSIIGNSYTRGSKGMTTSDKIDKIVTNRILALPIFAAIMTFVYFVSAKLVGGPVTDWVNDDLLTDTIGGGIAKILESVGTASWLESLIVDGIIGGVGAVLGFLPIIATLYLFLAILEDVGYMSRIAFILDRVFRKFGLSGKSFIPILIGTGCSVPGIMATRTIENEKDRKMTIIVASFMPCGAKTDIIALFVAAFGVWYLAPIAYFIGIFAVVVSGIILKKLSIFEGDPAPFVMELPQYHMPSATNVAKSVWNRCKAFIVKAGTIILVATVVIWFLQNISVHGEFVEFNESTDSLLAAVGKFFAPIFVPLGFGNWMATVASAVGLVAKEAVVSTYGVVAGVGADLGPDSMSLTQAVAAQFTFVSALSFMVFNQLNIPCFAAIGAIKSEMQSRKWTSFALVYQTLFSYTMALMTFQFGTFMVTRQFTVGTGVGLIILAIYLFLLFRRPSQSRKEETGKVVLEGK